MIKFFQKKGEQRVISAIQETECMTSGEVRVHVQEHCRGDILKDAARVFKALAMEKTEERNGVLIYIVPERHKFAVIGDKAINDKVSENYWDDVRDVMQKHFRNQDFTGGTVAAVQLVGKKLKEHFPFKEGDKNELPDDISYG
ncbi:MAG: putative membrane protein [Paraglaciecola sp.]|jgi:uncharacterized membrane protein